MEAKPVAASAIYNRIIEGAFDEEAESLLGGKLMQSIDLLAASVAERHAGVSCVVQSVDSRFANPVHRGDVLTCKAVVNKTWGKVLEVGVTVIAEDFSTLEQKEVLLAFFTFASPEEIAPIFPETDEEKESFDKAELRRQYRLIPNMTH